MLLWYVQDEKRKKRILHACHVDATAGHMGRTRTLCRIRVRFMWHGMVKNVQNMVSDLYFGSFVAKSISDISVLFIQLSKRDVCQRMNRKLTTGKPALNSIPVKAPWSMVGINFIGPISPTADDGSHYILTLSDYCTKWVEAIPTADKSVASALHQVGIVYSYTYS